MQNLVITIDWAYFLGIMGALIGIAWYTSARFARIESLIDNVDKRMSLLENRLCAVEREIIDLGKRIFHLETMMKK